MKLLATYCTTPDGSGTNQTMNNIQSLIGKSFISNGYNNKNDNPAKFKEVENDFFIVEFEDIVTNEIKTVEYKILLVLKYIKDETWKLL